METKLLYYTIPTLHRSNGHLLDVAACSLGTHATGDWGYMDSCNGGQRILMLVVQAVMLTRKIPVGTVIRRLISARPVGRLMQVSVAGQDIQILIRGAR